MDLAIEYLARIYDKETGKTIEAVTLKTKAIKYANTIEVFGLRHAEQIHLIQKSQDIYLKYQAELMCNKATHCPHCGKKLRRQGAFKSQLNDVYTDHTLEMNRYSCQCGWKNKFTVSGLFGKSIHPELAKIQSVLGSDKSYEKASEILNILCCANRKANNHASIRNHVKIVGETLNELKHSSSWATSSEVTQEIIVTTDGGHVQSREESKHTFEEIVSTVYRPEDVIQVGKDRNEIKEKICVASAKQDGQKTIKQLTLNACKKMGMTSETQVVALTDGAKNCWSIFKALEGNCSSIIKILDWFHIGKKFKTIEYYVSEGLRKLYEKAKWHLWHGHPQTAKVRLNQVKSKLTNEVAIERINGLLDYIKNNEAYIINYHARRLKRLPYTSQLAESSVNSVINQRQKNKKMQWLRESAHSLLQIITSRFSKSWDSDWQFVVNHLYKSA